MRYILTSIQPYYVFFIIARAMGWKVEREKTVEVRKNFPQAGDWNKKSLIYCSRDRRSLNRIPKEYQPLMAQFLGKVIGEFVCDEIYEIFTYQESDNTIAAYSNGMEKNGLDLEETTCLTEEELVEYLSDVPRCAGYGLHISDLKIYDKPKELGAFIAPCKWGHRIDDEDYECLLPRPKEKCQYECADKNPDGSVNIFTCGLRKPFTRPPQSWMYVEEI